jgi:hypothetical protein
MFFSRDLNEMPQEQYVTTGKCSHFSSSKANQANIAAIL